METKIVPCNGCTACCHDVGSGVRLEEDEKNYYIQKWENGKDNWVLETKEEGVCIFLDTKQNQCSIYDERPLACRSFDCRELWKAFAYETPKNLQQISTWKSPAVLLIGQSLT